MRDSINIETVHPGAIRRSLAFGFCLLAFAGLSGAGAPVRQSETPQPLRISENHRYLIDANGRPFLLQGDAGGR